MFKKRQVTGVSQRRRHLTGKNGDEAAVDKVAAGHRLSEDAQDEEEVNKRVQSAKDIHRHLRQRPRGLVATSFGADGLELKFEGSRESQQSRGDQLQESKFHMLDKAFRQQGDKSEATTKMDPLLEDFLLTYTKEANGKLDEETAGESKLPEVDLEKQLYEIPEHLQVQDIAQVEKDKMSWLSGLTEVPIAMEEKLKNIEETERMKRKALEGNGSQPAECPRRSYVNKRHKKG